MKKLLFTLLILFGAISSFAQNSAKLSYCAGMSSDIAKLTFEGQQTIDAAIYMPAEYLKPYIGSDITNVRFAIVSRIGVESVTAWIRHDLNSNNLVEATIDKETTPKPKRSWNKIKFPQSYTIEEGKGLYIGVTYRQTQTATVLSVLGPEVDNSFFINKNNGNGWEDYKEHGLLSLEAIVEGANLPNYDLAIIGSSTKINGTSVTYKTLIQNNGTQPINNFYLKYDPQNGNEPYVQHFDNLVNAGDTLTVFTPAPYHASSVNYSAPVKISLVSLGNGEDAINLNNTTTSTYVFHKKVLFEEFTTEGCGYCPLLAKDIHTAREPEKYKTNTYVACHHSGYYTDQFTSQADIEYLWLYNNGGKYGAPKLMCNRRPYAQASGGPTPVWSAASPSDIQFAADIEMKSDAYAAFTKFEGSFNEKTGYLTMNFKGIRSKEFCDTPARITVYLTEDGIDGSGQNGAPSGFKHNHVIRAYNSTWGDVINWNNNEFEHQVQLGVSGRWVKDKLQIIAFISSYDRTNPGNCIIENVDGIAFPLLTSISDVDEKTSQVEHIEYYKLDGTKIQSLEGQSGVIIVKSKDTNGKTSTKKVIL